MCRKEGKPNHWDENPYFPSKRELEGEIGSLPISRTQAEALLINQHDRLDPKQKAALRRIADLEGPDAEGDLATEYAKEFQDDDDDWYRCLGE